MRQTFRFIILLLVFFVGISVAVVNAHHVVLNYYLGSSDLPLSLLLVAVLAAGALLGVTAALNMVLRYRTASKKLQKRLQVLEEEVRALRSLPMREHK